MDWSPGGAFYTASLMVFEHNLKAMWSLGNVLCMGCGVHGLNTFIKLTQLYTLGPVQSTAHKQSQRQEKAQKRTSQVMNPLGRQELALNSLAMSHYYGPSSVGGGSENSLLTHVIRHAPSLCLVAFPELVCLVEPNGSFSLGSTYLASGTVPDSCRHLRAPHVPLLHTGHQQSGTPGRHATTGRKRFVHVPSVVCKTMVFRHISSRLENT